MSEYEKLRLRQFVDIVESDGIVRPEHLQEVAEIIGRMLLFEERRRTEMAKLQK